MIKEEMTQSAPLKQPDFDFMTVIYVDLIFVSIGFLIYIFTSLAWIIALFFGVGVLIGVTIEYVSYHKAKEAQKIEDKQDKQAEGYNLDEEFQCEWNENKEDDGVYVKSLQLFQYSIHTHSVQSSDH